MLSTSNDIKTALQMATHAQLQDLASQLCTTDLNLDKIQNIYNQTSLNQRSTAPDLLKFLFCIVEIREGQGYSFESLIDA